MRKIFFSSLVFLLCLSLNAQDLALVRESGKWGYFSKAGSYQIAPQYKSALSFSEQLAAVEVGGLWGYIDTQGSWVIQPQFSGAKSFHSGIALVKDEGSWFYIDRNAVKMPFESQDKLYDFNSGVAFYRSGNLVGLINAQFQVILEAKYQVIRKFEGQFARVQRDKKWGIINLEGKERVTASYDKIGNYHDGLSWGVKDGVYGLIDNNQFIAVEGVDQFLDICDTQFIGARKHGLYGFVQADGSWVIAPTFAEVQNFSHQRAAVKIKNKWGYIDTSAKLVIQPEYQDALAFTADGLAAVKKGQWGFIDANGAEVIAFNYGITAFSLSKQEKGFVKGWAKVKRSGQWGLINTDGILLGKRWFDNVENFQN